MQNTILSAFRCGGQHTVASADLVDWLASTDTDRSYLPMMQYRLAGRASAECEDVYYIAMDGDKILSRLWYGWGKHPNAIGNFGNFMTLENARGQGVGKKLLELWHNDLEQEQNKPLGLFCSATNGYLIDLYGGYGFTQAVIKPGFSMLYKPVGDSPATFLELCEDYYCQAKNLIIKPATVGWRHEIDCLLKFALVSDGESFGLPGCNSVEETIVWPHIGDAQILFTDKNRAVGWSFTGVDGVTYWQIHPKFRNMFNDLQKDRG